MNEAVAVLALLAALAEEGTGAPGALAGQFRARELDQPARILTRWADGEIGRDYGGKNPRHPM